MPRGLVGGPLSRMTPGAAAVWRTGYAAVSRTTGDWSSSPESRHQESQSRREGDWGGPRLFGARAGVQGCSDLCRPGVKALVPSVRDKQDLRRVRYGAVCSCGGRGKSACDGTSTPRLGTFSRARATAAGTPGTEQGKTGAEEEASETCSD